MGGLHAFRGRVSPPLCAQHRVPQPSATRTPALPEYRLIGKKGEGTFSEVLKAQCIKNGKYVAIKCMKNHFDSLEQVPPPRAPSVPAQRHPPRRCGKERPSLTRPRTSPPQVNNLREIQALRRLSPHPGIIKLCEVLYDQPTVCCIPPPTPPSCLLSPHCYHLPLASFSLHRLLLLCTSFLLSTSLHPLHPLLLSTAPSSTHTPSSTHPPPPSFSGPSRARLRADGHEHL